jgi:hypothetical protein
VTHNSAKQRLQRWAKSLQTIHLQSFHNYTADILSHISVGVDLKTDAKAEHMHKEDIRQTELIQHQTLTWIFNQFHT